jgi:uncharacterized repeat protein (TIGR04138 family)
MTKKTDKQRERFVQLLQDDPRYAWESYVFVREALFYAQEVLEMGASPDEDSAEPETFASGEFDPEEADEEGRCAKRPERHLTGQQLCQAIRNYALEQYGYMAQVVLASWGIRSTADIGEIVYNLIAIEEMKKSPTDRREDFDDVFDFDEVFRRSFQITRVP